MIILIRQNADVAGPLGLIYKALATMGWNWKSAYVIITDAGSAYDLRHVDQGEWEHLIREGLRKAAWKKAEGRRNDMQGIGGGVERDVTMALLSSDKLNDEQAGLLRCVLTGSIWTQDRLHRAGMKTTPICPFCGTEQIEDHEHLWWGCPRWAHVRKQYPEVVRASSDTWPQCLRLCGMMLTDTAIHVADE